MVMERDDRQVRDTIVKYFSQFTNITVGDETAINNDIGLTVSEYCDISFFFKKEFNIDLSPMAEGKYFMDEIPYSMWDFFKWKSKSEDGGRKPPITVGHLVNVVQQGKWFDPTK